MITLQEVSDRISRAVKAGWTFEDTRLTPGVPTYGMKRPSGEPAGIIGFLSCERHASHANEQLDKFGVPE